MNVFFTSNIFSYQTSQFHSINDAFSTCGDEFPNSEVSKGEGPLRFTNHSAEQNVFLS
jgi:hypothetical protein